MIGNAEYAQFLAGKTPTIEHVGIEPGPMNGALYDFQRAAVDFCLRRGRAALFLDTGLGKTLCELEFATQAARVTNGHALILTPLAVARQIEAEAARFGFNARVVREQSEVGPGISICNYDRLDKLEPDFFGCVVLDESSILKSFTGKTTRALIGAFAGTPFRLAATATPAPNDHMELGQHAEFLGIMPSNEMLMRWFLADQTQMGHYRLKSHAVTPFWDWMASWAVMAESPEDMGFDGSRFVLPPMKVFRHQVIGDVRAPAGSLFMEDLSATNIHDVKRQTAQARAAKVAELIAADPDAPWVVWCDTDYEADALAARLPDAVEVRGSYAVEKKEAAIAAFGAGAANVIITKPSVCGQGLNWQHAARMAFVGRSFSYESWYQAVRRCWRFGQASPVDVHLIVAEGEDQIGRVIDRKAEGHAAMKQAMRNASRRASDRNSAVKIAYNPTHQGRLPRWLSAV
jgi:superfamily II DNA or RNA helicase